MDLKTGVKKRAKSGFDVERIRKDFPVLSQKIYGKPLVYLDNAATTQKPACVIQALERFYTSENANIHRGIYYLSQQATHSYEGVRTKVRQFLNAREDREIIFVRGTTEAINLVAQTYGKAFLKKDDEIVITTMEHHSNIVPWQMLCGEIGIKLRVVPIHDSGELILEEFEKLLNPKTKFISVVHISNTLGTINPIRKLIEKAHARSIPVLIDGAQGVAHLPVDLQALDCDFYAFSGHKMYGPTGVGVLYGKAKWLEAMPPYQGGGDMISSVTFEKTRYNKIPYKFEAGTPNIAGVIGLGSAIDYLTGIGLDSIHQYENELLVYANQALSQIKDLRVIGEATEKAGIISFVLGDIHAHDIGTILDHEAIAIRAGHHCTMPLMDRYQVPATARASFALYNTRKEIDALASAIQKVKGVFS